MKETLIIFFAAFFLFSCKKELYMQPSNNQLAQQILADKTLDTVQQRALKLLTSFNAGSTYDEVWIRDLNTFIKGSLKAANQAKIRDVLMTFFKAQGKDGNIADGFVSQAKATVGYNYYYSALVPGMAFHKNTVATDQESSLIQAVKKYIDITGDKSILTEQIDGTTVAQRMDAALTYLLNNRWSAKYGLITGATTVDWGDVQAEEGWGVTINEKTKWAIDIYDNAMFLLAVQDLIGMTADASKWNLISSKLTNNIRKYLWDSKANKYLTHLYLNGSPFKANVNENNMIFTGGTATAILAGLNSQDEIKAINRQFVGIAMKYRFATIGITVYPPYPTQSFVNMPPYQYQNGGDWTWFGARMIQALVINRMPNEAYTELQPMIARVIKNQGFFEWYDVFSGDAKGAADFRGEAGVLYDAIVLMKQWAEANK